MPKKDCDFETNISNGGKIGLAMFIVGVGASIMKRLKRPRRSTPKKKG